MVLLVMNTLPLVQQFTQYVKKNCFNEEINDDFFVQELKKNISDLDEEHDVNKKLCLI
jgi:hypothetical protein